MILLLISFLAGVLTVLTPCVLPMLPVIIGSSVAEGENRRKAYAVTLSLGVSVIVFTLLLKVSTIFIMVPEHALEIFSGVIILILGIFMLFPAAWDKLGGVGFLNRKSNELLSEGYKKKSLAGDIIMGAALGPVFSSCSPTYFVILATVLPRSLGAGIVDLVAYAVGLSLMLLLISLFGQKLITKLGLASDPNGWFRKIIGVLLIVVGIAIMTGLDKTIESNLANKGIFDATLIEERLLNSSNPTQ